jgi:hypothetical protein
MKVSNVIGEETSVIMIHIPIHYSVTEQFPM